MCVLLCCESCDFVKPILCILRCYFPSIINVFCIFCSQEWKYISCKIPHENKINFKNFSKMKYNNQEKLIYSNYEGKNLIIIDYYEEAFCHYIPVLVLVKDYFEHVIQKFDKKSL